MTFLGKIHIEKSSSVILIKSLLGLYICIFLGKLPSGTFSFKSSDLYRRSKVYKALELKTTWI